MDTKELGNLGEELACEYLVNKGYKILCRNYRINLGEIDIIAQKKWHLFGEKDKTIHFVEVKALFKNSAFCPEDHVDYRKQNKYKKLVEIWLNKNKFTQDYPCQVDVIAVMGEQIDFLENVISN